MSGLMPRAFFTRNGKQDELLGWFNRHTVVGDGSDRLRRWKSE